jgi:hypothetical protein
LGDCSRCNWYPVKAGDLLGAAHKLGADRAEIEKLLSRSGFFLTASDFVGGVSNTNLSLMEQEAG